MTPPGTFDRVYAAIKQRLRDGVYRPGNRLEPAILSDELNASVTPVRDALHRLTGERLVEAPRHEGFRVPMLTEPALRQLYGWHLDLLLLALMKRQPGAERLDAHLEPAPVSPDGVNAFFLHLARSTGNLEHLAALEAIEPRLAPIRRFEEHFLDGIEAETEGIVEAIQAHDGKTVRRALVRYHRRRQKIVPELLARLLEAGAPARD